MSKTIDALKTAIDTLSKVIEDLKSENTSLKSEIQILKGKLAIAELKNGNRDVVRPVFPTLPSVPTWPETPTYPTAPSWPGNPWRPGPIITWTSDHVEPSWMKTKTTSNEMDVEEMKISCHVQ